MVSQDGAVALNSSPQRMQAAAYSCTAVGEMEVVAENAPQVAKKSPDVAGEAVPKAWR